MALQFPSNPSNGTVFEHWIWDAASNMWVCITPATNNTGMIFTAPFTVNDTAGEVQLWVTADGQAGIESRPSGLAWILEPTGQAILGAHTGISWLSFDAMTGELKLTPSGDFTIPSGSITVGGPLTAAGPTTLGDTTVSSLTIANGSTVNDLALSTRGITVRGDGSGSLGTAPNQLIWDANGVFSTTGTATVPGGGGEGADTLATLADVSLAAPTDGQVLAWNATTQRWVNSAPGGTASLGQLSDVSIATPTAGQQLVWNGLAWVNQTPPPVGGTGTVTSITAGVGLTGGTIQTTGIIGLMNTPVQAGAYNSPNLTIDAQGRITAASNGSLNSLLGPMTPSPGQLLGWNGTRWINVPPGSAAGTLAALNDVSVGNMQHDQVLSWTGAYWTNQALPLHTLESLNDVSVAGAALGQVLTWDGTKWENQNPPYGGAANLTQLYDVAVSGQTNGQVLTWDAVQGKWIAATPSGVSTLGTLTDVSVPAPTVNQVLTWNGSQWVAQAPAPSGVTSLTPLGSGVFIQSGLNFSANPITTTGSIGVDWGIVPNLGTANTFTQSNAFNSSVWCMQPINLGMPTNNATSGYAAYNSNGFPTATARWWAGCDVSSLGGGAGASWGILNMAGPPTGTSGLPYGPYAGFRLVCDAVSGNLVLGGGIVSPGPLPSITTLNDVGHMNPTTGDVLMWVGTRWDSRPAALSGAAVVSASAPANPPAGSLWWDTTGAQLYVFDGLQWVIAVNVG